MKPTIRLHLVPRSPMRGINLHSPIRVTGVVLNYATGTSKCHEPLHFIADLKVI
jgi:hypothetical protein